MRVSHNGDDSKAKNTEELKNKTKKKNRCLELLMLNNPSEGKYSITTLADLGHLSFLSTFHWAAAGFMKIGIPTLD